MGSFSLRAWGFIFFLIDIILAGLIFLLCVLPTRVCPSAGSCTHLVSLYDNELTFPMTAALFALVVNGVWAILQHRPLSNWSAIVFAGESEQRDLGSEVMIEAYRLFIPRWGPTITFAILYFISGIVAAHASRHCNECERVGSTVGLWAASSFFAFLAAIVYAVETFCVFKRTHEYDGI